MSALTARSKTSFSPREGTRPAIFPRDSAGVVGTVPSPGGFFNRLLNALCHELKKVHGRNECSGRCSKGGTPTEATETVAFPFLNRTFTSQ